MSGIINLLHNCYVNSSIQVISIIPELRKALVKHSTEHSNGKHHFLICGFPAIFLWSNLVKLTLHLRLKYNFFNFSGL